MEKNYKGIFYNNDNKKNYYEFGAHFRYKELFNRLLILQKLQKEESKSNPNINIQKSSININKNNLNKSNILNSNSKTEISNNKKIIKKISESRNTLISNISPFFRRKNENLEKVKNNFSNFNNNVLTHKQLLKNDNKTISLPKINIGNSFEKNIYKIHKNNNSHKEINNTEKYYIYTSRNKIINQKLSLNTNQLYKNKKIEIFNDKKDNILTERKITDYNFINNTHKKQKSLNLNIMARILKSPNKKILDSKKKLFLQKNKIFLNHKNK